MTTPELELGLDTFGYITVDEAGNPLPPDVVIRDYVEEAVFADSVGIDSFNIGEHYRPDFMDSAAHVMLAAIAGRTKRIRLGTAVTVLSTQDPVRVYTNFATLDAVSNGRAQLVTWSGKFRSPLVNQYVTPALPKGHLPSWVGVGGSPQSVVRAARYGLPLMLAVIGGPPARFAPLVELYKRALDAYGQPPLPIGMHSHGYVARTDEEAVEIQWPYWAETFEQAARERGWARPTMTRFQAERASGSLYIGSPETVATKIGAMMRLLGLSRFDLAYATGRVPHKQRLATIELYGREVIPRVRELLADHAVPPISSAYASAGVTAQPRG